METQEKQTFIISSICFPKKFSKQPLPAVLPEEKAQEHLQRIEKETLEYKKIKQSEEIEELGTMDLDMEREASAMLGVDNDVEVIAVSTFFNKSIINNRNVCH